jgi:hypothetical protein
MAPPGLSLCGRVMAGTSWAVWAVLSAIAAAASVWHYRRRETPGRGRMLLAGLRAAAVAVLLLILFDPELPAAGGVGPGRAPQLLLDGSLSMTLPTAAGPTRWQQAVEIARQRAGGRDVLVFGDATRPLPPNALPAQAPGDARSRLLPALQAAAEAGVGRVLVVTDGAIEDADAVARWLPRLGLEVAFEVVGDVVANRSLIEAEAPAWAEAGQPTRLEFGVAASGTVAEDSVTVQARVDGRVVGRTTVAAPAPGRLATGALELRLDAPPGGGLVPVSLELEGDDAVPDDDVRTLYIDVAEEPAGIVLVSFVPDWEPRFLAPVLQQAAGLPLRGFLRGAAGQYVRLGAGLDAGARVGEADVQRAVQRAVAQTGLLVLHGIGDDAPEWATAALRSAPRVLVFPAGPASELPLPVEVGPAAAGDFFPYRDVPPSPVAPLLADAPLAGAVPLYALRTAAPVAGAWAPLHVSRGRQGAPQPAILAGQTGQRRWAVALGSGYWQWAFRGDDERVLYQRLWGALGGWLVRDRGGVAPEPVRPARQATPRGMPLAWLAPGLAADSLAITLTAADGAVALDTVVTATAADTAFTTSPGPGHYSYRARAFAGDTVTSAEGVLTVETYSPEFARQPVDLTALRAPATAVRAGEAARLGTPLHAAAWPYVVVVLLLALEWVLRRRWGLR